MIRLLWAIHSHQPVGNFDFVFARAYDQAYRPFLETLRRHPAVRLSLHYSGILLDWLDKNRPEFIAALRDRVEAGQVEILGGGYYEPILPILSDFHKRGQLEKLQQRIRGLFGVTPRGLWLAERVWEPGLVKPIAEAGLEYVVLDGSHFKMVGKTDKDWDGYFLTEDQGRTLKLFPIHDIIRDQIPFRGVEELLENLHRLDRPGETVQVVFGDDGEKFGDWPHTHHLVYGEEWLHRFFSAVEASEGRIRIDRMDAGLEASKNQGLVYLPAASYMEMMNWAQPASDIRGLREARRILEAGGGGNLEHFLKGSFWRNFLVKYAESNRLHKHMTRLSAAWERRREEDPGFDADEALLDSLRQAQCNCAYWHGVFGGLYLPHLRFALYRHLIAVQTALDERAFAETGQRAFHEAVDWNCDGETEHLLHTPFFLVAFSARGEVEALWLKKTGVNLADTLTRRPEAYHAALGGGGGGTKLEDQLGAKEANLGDHLVYDRKVRNSLAERFLPAGTPFSAYASQQAEDEFLLAGPPAGGLFPEAAFSLEGGEAVIRFTGMLKSRRAEAETGEGVNGSGSPGPGLFTKTCRIALDRAELRAEWSFTAGEDGFAVRFLCENLFCLLAGNAPDRYLTWTEASPAGAVPLPRRDILASRGEMRGAARAVLRDEWLKLTATLAVEAMAGPAAAPAAGAAPEEKAAGLLWRDALETVSQSEGGYERVYQGTVVAPVWDLEIAPGGRAERALRIRFGEEE